LDAIEAALAARLIVEHHEPGSYRFAHDLVRETLFEGVLAPRRARLHARYGEALEAAPASTRPPQSWHTTSARRPPSLRPRRRPPALA